MSTRIDTVLKSLLDRYGMGLLDQSGRLKSLLHDEAPDAKREISVLMLALDERVPQDLMRVQSGEPLTSLRPRLARRLIDEKALDSGASDWAVSTWAQGLGVAAPEDFVPGRVLPPDPDDSNASRIGFTARLPEPGRDAAATDGGEAGSGAGARSWLARNKWLVGGALVLALLASLLAVPGKPEITAVHPVDKLVADGRKHDIVVEFKAPKSPITAIEVHYVSGAGTWNPTTWTAPVGADAANGGAVSAGALAIRAPNAVTTTFSYTLVAQDGSRSAPVERTFEFAAPPVSPSDMGVVTGIREVTVQGQSTGLGAVVGGILGGVLGHQVGSGHGNTAATVAGAVTGAVAGNLVEQNANSKKTYQVIVRMDDGHTKYFSAAGYPTLKPGDRVKFVNSALQLDR
ncbi:MAG: glycine zipper 2TM domain-containing protein [Proteobacteria bacterium]|nr:glycine zipper 2TM domain-containing protein [Pseudomonadota bacterium]